MRHAVKFVVSIVVVALIAAFYALLNIDLNDYKQQIEEATTEATGRQLRLEGDVSIAWSLIPTLVIEKAHFSNAAWGSAADMVSLDKFEVRLALYPLIKRDIQVTKVLLIGPHILIETNKAGVGNWVFDSVAELEAPESEAGEASSFQSVIVNELDIEQAQIHYIDGVTGDKKQFSIDQLSIDVADLEAPLDVLLKAITDDIPVALDGQVGGVTALLENTDSSLDLKVNIGDVDVTLKGHIAQPHEGKGAVLAIDLNTNDSALSTLSGSELPAFGALAIKGDVETDVVSDKLMLDLSAAMDGLVLLLKGHIAKPQAGKGVALDVDLKTDSPTLSLLSGSEIPALGDIALKGLVSNSLKTDAVKLDLTALAEGLTVLVKGHVLKPQQGDGIALDVKVDTNSSALSILAGSELPPIGEIKLSGGLSGDAKVYQFNGLKLNAGKTDLKGDIRISLAGDRPQVVATLVSHKIDLIPLEQMDKSPESEPTSERLFSDEPLVLQAFKELDAKIDIEVQEIDSASIQLRKVDVGVDLQNGHLKVLPLDLAFAGSRLQGNFDLNAQRDNAVLSTKMEVNGFKLEKIKALKEAISGGSTDVYIQAKGRGMTMKQLMAGLNGKAVVKVGESQISDGTLDILGADFVTELVNLLNPFSKEKKGTELACAVVNFNIKSGIATADKGIAIRTGKMNIVGDGTINLKTEKIDIGITPEARTGVGINMTDLVGLVRVGGTLAEPSALVDKTAVLEAGLSTGAAVATGGLSIVAEGLLDSATADENPCETALSGPKKKPE